jgi:hypothetical protein
MRLAQYERKGDDEQLITEIIVNVQDPAAPIFETPCRGEGSHDTRRVITRLGEVVYHGAAAIDEKLVSVGAVEIDVGHVQHPSNTASPRRWLPREPVPWPHQFAKLSPLAAGSRRQGLSADPQSHYRSWFLLR